MDRPDSTDPQYRANDGSWLEDIEAWADILEAALAVDLGDWVDFDVYDGMLIGDEGLMHWDILPLAYAIALWQAAGEPENAEDY